ncbi:MAG: hypothetical protein IKF78_10755 [Atopobiaceae bacterium]|nr:hypothetical protein [Atopobiaceae bacterium]
MKDYRCTGCYAHLFASEDAAQRICPHCGAKTKLVMSNSQIESISYVPFIVTRRQALKNYSLALRNEARQAKESSLAESVVSAQGVFVPCWLKSGEVDFDFSFDVHDGEPLMRNRTTGNERRAGRIAFSSIRLHLTPKAMNRRNRGIAPNAPLA